MQGARDSLVLLKSFSLHMYAILIKNTVTLRLASSFLAAIDMDTIHLISCDKLYLESIMQICLHT